MPGADARPATTRPTLPFFVQTKAFPLRFKFNLNSIEIVTGPLNDLLPNVGAVIAAVGQVALPFVARALVFVYVCARLARTKQKRMSLIIGCDGTLSQS